MECGGTGVVGNHWWSHFYDADEAFEKQYKRMMTPEEMEDWFSKQGLHRIPPEESTCGECDGRGKIESWQDIAIFKPQII